MKNADLKVKNSRKSLAKAKHFQLYFSRALRIGYISFNLR